MPLVCHNGQIAISDMMDLSNKNETDVAAAKIVADQAKITNDAQDISIDVLDGRVVVLESGGSLPAVSAEVAQLALALTNVTTELADNTQDIGDARVITDQLVIDVADHESRIDVNETAIAALGGSGATGPVLYATDATSIPDAVMNQLITQNDLAVQISMHAPDLIDNFEFLSRDKTFLIAEHKVATTISGGNCTAGSWEVRSLNVIQANYLPLSSIVGNRIQLSDAGDYEISGYAICTGGYNQSRIFDETTSMEILAGSSGEDGKSIFSGVVTLGAGSILRLETQSSVTTVDGFGTPNPFGDGIFSSIKIQKIG